MSRLKNLVAEFSDEELMQILATAKAARKMELKFVECDLCAGVGIISPDKTFRCLICGRIIERDDNV